MKETFGQRFHKLRKTHNLTQEDIAKKLNISAQAVSKWENDISSPDISLLGEIANIFNVSIDELLGNKREETIIVPEDKRKDINQMMLRVRMRSANNDKVNINLPMGLVLVCIESGVNIGNISGDSTLNQIDFKQIVYLVKQGAAGKIVEIETTDGSVIDVYVE